MLSKVLEKVLCLNYTVHHPLSPKSCGPVLKIHVPTMPPPRLSSIKQRSLHALRPPKSQHLLHENGTSYVQRVAGRMIIKALRSPLEAGLVNTAIIMMSVSYDKKKEDAPAKKGCLH
eukprot:1001111-Pelagomonas_calceolata.AAC.1